MFFKNIMFTIFGAICLLLLQATLVPAKLASETDPEMIHTHIYSNAASISKAHGPLSHVVSTVAQNNDVGNALAIPIGILQSLQISLGNLKPAPTPNQG